MLHVGVDWGDQAHHVCVVDDRGKQVKAFRFDHIAKGFAELLEKIRALQSDKNQVSFCLETSHGLLVEFLLDQGYKVYPVNPKASDRCRDRYKVSGAKDDVLDARVLAHFLRTDRAMLRELLPSSPLARELKLWVQGRQSLVRAKTRVVNQLTATLKSYFPKPLELFDLQSDIALAFLKRFPTPHALQKLTCAKLQRFLQSHSYSAPARLEKIWSSLQTPSIPVEDFVVQAQSPLVLALVEQLQGLLNQIAVFEAAIQQRLNVHPDREIFQSLPGAGATLHAQLLACFGDNRAVYPTFQSVQRQAGTCPITKQSGAFRAVRFRRACHHLFRNVLQLYAFSSLRKSLWARSYYDKKRQAGASHEQALRCLANIWAKIIHTLWQNRTLYDENIRLAAIARHALHQPFLVGA